VNKAYRIQSSQGCTYVKPTRYYVLWPTNAKLFYKSSPSYMFRHYRVMFMEFVINILPSYTGISNAAIGNTIYN